MENLTPSQQSAIAARGNVLVMAGAGTGKTHTLVARCLNLICEEKISLDEILVVTFTEAAATEMKQRLRTALEKNSQENPGSHLSEQIALFDTSHIGTLHGFCFKLVREHFYKLGLDPQISILDEGPTRLLADETLEEIFNSHYENEDEFSLAVQHLIKTYGSGRDEKIRALALHLHNYIQTRADAESWLARQIENFSSSEPLQWREWLAEANVNWRDEWLSTLENLRVENIKAGECLEIFKKIKSSELFQKILAADADWPRGTKKNRKPLEDFFDGANFLNSLLATEKNDPLAEDWRWVRGQMKALLQLAREFSENYSAQKRAGGVLDFHDLEQFALKLLWNFETDKPSETAKNWRDKLRFVFVDEYQDINAAQDKIISALSRDGADANRFLVGDVKQSIYRFRLANPKIFRDYAKSWRGEKGRTIQLTENFRSCGQLLNFINSLFALLFREEIGGIKYDDETKLKFGSPGTRAKFPLQKDSEPKAELLLRLKKVQDENSESEDGNDEIADLDESEKEARMLALRLGELKNSGREIWDDSQKKSRAADWRDMAILMRAPSGKSEIFARQFERAGIPLVAERGGFYDSSEISDLLCLLHLLDNPLQDVPLIAVLRSPLVGCSLDELAKIRLAAPREKFWTALNYWIKTENEDLKTGTAAKISRFLERFSLWRKIAKQISLSQCLEEILAETNYADWLKSRTRGAQKHSNVARFLNLAEKFDQFQHQGLFRFLKFVEAQREIESEPEAAPVVEGNAVRLMSIHQSKGLEFPIVALADLAKGFNEQDLRGEIIFDEEFGLCPRVKPPNAGGHYPSLPHWLAQKNQRRELRGEELRLLYVALTRARDFLILSGSITAKKWETLLADADEITSQKILSAKSFADWIGLWFARNQQSPHLRLRIFEDAELTEKSEILNLKSEIKLPPLDKNTKSKLQKMLEWQYGFDAAAKRAAKSSVTVLQRQAADESDDEAKQIFQNRKSETGNRKLGAVDMGTAHHKFLQFVSLEAVGRLAALQAEAERLECEKALSADERAALVLENIAAFWNSDAGRKIRKQPQEFVKRELAFTAKFSPNELSEITGAKSEAGLENEFVVVQGVADLAVILPQEIWLVDFKTDNIRANELEEKTKTYLPQLKLYSNALVKIYSRPVTNTWLHFLAAQKTVEI